MTEAIPLFRPLFKEAGFPLPPGMIGIQCGCCQGGNWGEYFHTKPPCIKVTYRLHKRKQVLDVIHHELAHCATAYLMKTHGYNDGSNDCHGPLFQTVIRATGHYQYDGQGWAQDLWRAWAKQLGSYKGKFGVRHAADRLQFTCSCGRKRVIWWDGHRYVSGSWRYGATGWTCGRKDHKQQRKFYLV